MKSRARFCYRERNSQSGYIEMHCNMIRDQRVNTAPSQAFDGIASILVNPDRGIAKR